MSAYKHYTNPDITQLPDGIRGINNNCVLAAPGLRIYGGSNSANAQTHTAFACRQDGLFSAPISGDTTMATLIGGNLAYDDGTVDPATGSCRCYTFLADISPTTGAATYSVIYGSDFPKHRPMYETDINLGDKTKVIIGFLYVKNESSAVFVPGSTKLDAVGITARFSDAWGYSVA